MQTDLTNPMTALPGATDDTGRPAVVLPILHHLGGVAPARVALDMALETRRGLLLCGPKGAGKGVGMELAIEWFDDRQAQLQNASYAKQRVLHVITPRDADYAETAVYLAQKVDKKYQPKARKASKSDADIKDDLVALCLQSRYAVIVMDEAEFASDDTLELLRDLMSGAESGTGRRRKEGVAAGGVGVVLIGDGTLENKVAATSEANERWMHVIHVHPLTPDEVVEVYDAWFPGFTPAIAQMGRAMWTNYLNSLVSQGRGVSFRVLENHARAYALYMQRNDPSLADLEQLPFDAELFSYAFQEARWSATPLLNRAEGSRFSDRTAWGGRRGDD